MFRHVQVAFIIACSACAGISHADNLITNPDFDDGLDGWSLSTNVQTAVLDNTQGIPTAPSVHLTGNALTVDDGLTSACIRIDDSQNVDFVVDINRTSGLATGDVVAFSDTTCTTFLQLALGTPTQPTNGAWTRYSTTNAALPDGTQSVRIELSVGMGSLGSPGDAYFDHVAFGPAGSLVTGGININQEGLTGAWFNPSTSGQGFEFVISPDTVTPAAGNLFGAWYTYDTTAGGTDTQRWYSLQALIPGDATSVDVTIYQNIGGTFAVPPVTSAVAVGTGTLSFDSCTIGSFAYAFDDGRSGTVYFQNLLSNVECDDSATPTTPTVSDFGLSGAWYDVDVGGQGLMINVNPVDGQVFIGWFTYAGDGGSTDVDGQRWFSAQGAYDVGSTTMDVGIYSSTGGTFDSNDTQVITDPVGTATLTFASCTAATLDYEFTAGDLSGSSGTIELTRLGSTLSSCGPPPN